MKDFMTVSYGTFVDCIDSACGGSDAFINQMITRTGGYDEITVTENGLPRFSIQFKDISMAISKSHVDAYANEIDTWF